jgi:hypothetical protein
MRADLNANSRMLPTLAALALPLNGIAEIAGPDQCVAASSSIRH